MTRKVGRTKTVRNYKSKFKINNCITDPNVVRVSAVWHGSVSSGITPLQQYLSFHFIVVESSFCHSVIYIIYVFPYTYI